MRILKQKLKRKDLKITNMEHLLKAIKEKELVNDGKSSSSRSQLWRNYGTRNIQESSEKYSNNIETCNVIHK